MPSMINTDDQDLKMQGQRGVLVNVNKSQYESYMAQRRAMESKNSEIARLDNEISIVKDDLSQIKALLQQLVQGNK